MMAAPPIEVPMAMFSRGWVFDLSSLNLYEPTCMLAVTGIRFEKIGQASLHGKDVLRARVGKDLHRDRLDEGRSEADHLDVSRSG